MGTDDTTPATNDVPGSLCSVGKNSWPELVGENGEKAAVKIEEESGDVEAIVVLEGTIVITDYRCTRVWVWINKQGLVIRVPHRG